MVRSVRIQVQRVAGAEDLPLPRYATDGAAGLDLFAAVTEPLRLVPGARAAIPTGLRFALPAGTEGQVRPRSGLARRHGIAMPNAPGTIDSDYRGEVHVLLWNTGSQPFEVARGDRIAQLVVAPVLHVELAETEALPTTARGDGGFGSTGSR
jgi:dUTP pyrophosphatase